MPQVASLFSGIGGFELGFRTAGFDTVSLCDLDESAGAVLAAHFPGVPLARDVRQLTKLPPCDVVTAGFPCQNLSMVGDKAGIGGAKSEIVSELFRLVGVTRPPWVIVENVRFMLWLRSGEAMSELVTEFERLGYSWAYRVLDSRWFGVPQRRKRVYFVASNVGRPEDVLLSDDGGDYVEPFTGEQTPIGFYWTEGRSGFGGTYDAIPTLKTGSGLGIPSPPAVLFIDGDVRIPSIRDAEMLQGFPAGWTAAADQIGPRMRWKLVGNAVTVNVAEWLGRNLIRPSRFSPKRQCVPLNASKRWPSAAFGSAGERYQAFVSDRPMNVSAARLSEHNCSTWQHLSTRAIDGFIARARSSRLRFPPHFVEALDAYSQRQAGLRMVGT